MGILKYLLRLYLFVLQNLENFYAADWRGLLKWGVYFSNDYLYRPKGSLYSSNDSVILFSRIHMTQSNIWRGEKSNSSYSEHIFTNYTFLGSLSLSFSTSVSEESIVIMHKLANSKNGRKNRKNEIKKRIQPREIIAHLFSSLLVESFHGDQVSICFFRLSSRIIIWKRNVRGLQERCVRGSREKGGKGLA